VGLANLGSESETCVGSLVHLVGVSISLEKNFYRLPFTPPSLVRRIGPSQPEPKPKLTRFHCDYCGRDGHKGEFCFKRKREERMAKEWANKDKYHSSNSVIEPHVQMPRARASVRTLAAWGKRKAAEGAAGRATPVRPVLV
jgi:hypothetical protein